MRVVELSEAAIFGAPCAAGELYPRGGRSEIELQSLRIGQCDIDGGIAAGTGGRIELIYPREGQQDGFEAKFILGH